MMRVLCLLVLMLPATLRAQFTYTLDNTIEVRGPDNNVLPLAWSGGLNAAQFNTLDLNGDGKEDLVLYDRMANKVITFLAADNRYVPSPEYEELFPADIYNWMLLRDFNCDGKKDLFTGDVLGMKVYINTTTAGQNLQWEPYLFTTGFEGPKSQVLLTKNPSTGIKVNLQLQFDDLPAISDIDGDGDLDILNIQYAGHTVEFHENRSMDEYQTCDSLEFVRVTRSWGSFRECSCGSMAFGGDPCPPNAGGRVQHAGGKSLLAIDLDGDQQQDLLFSEAECTRIFAIPNKGTAASPVFDSFFSFPQTDPVDFVLFPTPFYEDVDFDGKKDLIATPNIFSKEFLNSQLEKSTWLYKNTGTTTNPSFTFVKNNFLQGDMIDVGDNAVPAFADYNGDGLLDMFVSSHSSGSFTSRLLLFENTGTPDQPAFKVVSDDYLGFTTSRYYNVKIQFGDMDANQTTDLIFTATNFDNNVTSLYYLTNKSQTVLDFNGGTLNRVDFALTSTENIYVADISGDGLPDILAGRSEGNLEYWRNSGVAGVSPVFVLENEDYLGFASSTSMRQNLSAAIADLNGDGKRDLILGDQTGKPMVVSDFSSVQDGETASQQDLVFNALTKKYESKNLGGRIWPVAANLFNADKPALIFGNALGGVHILRHDDGKSLPEEPRVEIYPNPVYRQEILNIKPDRYGTMQLFSVTGQLVSTPVVLKANEVQQYRLGSLAAGLYLLKFTSNGRHVTQRIVIR